MEYYLFIARSITYAQRIENVLRHAGIPCQVFRAPMELSRQGCAYAIKIQKKYFLLAVKKIQGAKIGSVPIYLKTHNGYREVTNHDLF